MFEGVPVAVFVVRLRVIAGVNSVKRCYMPRITKKRKKELREAVKGDPYFEKFAEQLITLSNDLGKIRVLQKDELELAKYEIGLIDKIDKHTAKRQTKERERRSTPKKKSLEGIRKFINKKLNILLESRYSMHFDGATIHFLDIQKGIELEHTFLLIDTNPLTHPYGFFAKWVDVFEKEGRFKKDINQQKNEGRVGHWVEPDFKDRYNAYGRADYNLMSGGFVDVPEATYRKFDMVPAMLCAREFVFTQEAVRGAGGKYGHRHGAKFLTILNDFFEEEAKKYPHVHSDKGDNENE